MTMKERLFIAEELGSVELILGGSLSEISSFIPEETEKQLVLAKRKIAKLIEFVLEEDR